MSQFGEKNVPIWLSPSWDGNRYKSKHDTDELTSCHAALLSSTQNHAGGGCGAAGAPAAFTCWNHAAVFADRAGRRAGLAGDTQLQAELEERALLCGRVHSSWGKAVANRLSADNLRNKRAKEKVAKEHTVEFSQEQWR